MVVWSYPLVMEHDQTMLYHEWMADQPLAIFHIESLPDPLSQAFVAQTNLLIVHTLRLLVNQLTLPQFVYKALVHPEYGHNVHAQSVHHQRMEYIV